MFNNSTKLMNMGKNDMDNSAGATKVADNSWLF
jgi:hypothetical protein